MIPRSLFCPVIIYNILLRDYKEREKEETREGDDASSSATTDALTTFPKPSLSCYLVHVQTSPMQAKSSSVIFD